MAAGYPRREKDRIGMGPGHRKAEEKGRIRSTGKKDEGPNECWGNLGMISQKEFRNRKRGEEERVEIQGLM